jgi:hypothetical protein
MDNKLHLRGDRNDPYYDTIPKNWNSIKMEANSILNMNHARLIRRNKGLDMKQTNANINSFIILSGIWNLCRSFYC